MIALTNEERRKFLEWLESDAAQLEGLVGQMKTLPGPAMGTMIRHEEIRIAARRLLAREFRQTETFTIGTPDFKPGDNVIVDCDQYHGPGTFVAHREESIEVRISNGNHWNYPVPAVKKA